MEFAFLLPVMLTLFFGVFETSLALICQSDVVSITSTMSDLVAQKSTITNSDISNVLSAANTILYPYPPRRPRSSSPVLSTMAAPPAQGGLERRPGTPPPTAPARR